MQRWLMLVVGTSLIVNAVLALKTLDAPHVTNESFYHALEGKLHGAAVNLQQAGRKTGTSRQSVSLAYAFGQASYAEGLLMARSSSPQIYPLLQAMMHFDWNLQALIANGHVTAKQIRSRVRALNRTVADLSPALKSPHLSTKMVHRAVSDLESIS